MDRTLLPAIAAFSQVAREGSFTRAASVMGVSPSALSQTVRALERRLDARLLNRSTRSISLTEEGRRLLEQIDPGLALIDQAIGAVGAGQDRPAGEIRINTSRLASRVLIEPHLAEFGRRYPAIRVELVMDDGLGDIVHEGCDAGIRLRESVAASMIAVPLCTDFSFAVAGSPAYFAVHPIPQAPAELADHNCIRFRHASSGAIYRWEFTDPARPQRDIEVEPHGSFTTNDDEAMIRAALTGVGLVMHIEPALRPHIADGSLVRVLAPWCPPVPGFNLYLPTRSQMPAKMRAFIDFLIEKRDT
ncbi:MAG: LysR family transcriptional regulator [Pseudolabrys sp.]|nr:LysR family transcriptional regulator [Pseudolabrys sp.]